MTNEEDPMTEEQVTRTEERVRRWTLTRMPGSAGGGLVAFGHDHAGEFYADCERFPVLAAEDVERVLRDEVPEDTGHPVDLAVADLIDYVAERLGLDLTEGSNDDE